MQLLICRHAWLKFDNRLKLAPESEEDKNCFLCLVIFCYIEDFITYTFCILTQLLIYRYFGWILLKKKTKDNKRFAAYHNSQLLDSGQRSNFKCNICILLCFVKARDFIYPKILFRQFEEKRMLFQTRQDLLVKAMYQYAFFALENVLNFDRLKSDFESTTLKIC